MPFAMNFERFFSMLKYPLEHVRAVDNKTEIYGQFMTTYGSKEWHTKIHNCHMFLHVVYVTRHSEFERFILFYFILLSFEM